MLSWFASNTIPSSVQTQTSVYPSKDEHDEKTKDDVTGTIDLAQLRDHEDDDAPETPAPVFALRAFKHAIYGTPKTEDRLAAHRRQRKLERERERERARKTREKEAIRRPNTSSGIHRPSEEAQRQNEADVATPSKGILLTPGASAVSRRKTVSFNARHRDESEDRDGAITRSKLVPASLDADPQSGPLSPLGDQPRSKHPTKNLRHDKGPRKGPPTTPQRPHGRGVQLKGVRPQSMPSSVSDAPHLDSSSLAQGLDRQSTDKDLELELAHPTSISGRYWKHEYESFRSTSEVQMRKVLQKVQLAKRYAKAKEAENDDLRKTLAKQTDRITSLEKLLDRNSRVPTSDQEARQKETQPSNLNWSKDLVDTEPRADLLSTYDTDQLSLNLAPSLATTPSGRDKVPVGPSSRSRRSSPVAKNVQSTSTNQITKSDEAKHPSLHSEDIWANFATENDEKSSEKCINIESISPAKRLRPSRNPQSFTIRDDSESLRPELDRAPLFSGRDIGNKIPLDRSTNISKRSALGVVSKSSNINAMKENAPASHSRVELEKAIRPEQNLVTLASSKRSNDIPVSAKQRVNMRRGTRNSERPLAMSR